VRLVRSTLEDAYLAAVESASGDGVAEGAASAAARASGAGGAGGDETDDAEAARA
jgi:hypothetical protein